MPCKLAVKWTGLFLCVPVCAFPQRLYNEASDRKATEALALSQQLLSGQVWEKALSNLDELYKLRQQFVFDSTQATLKSEWAAWDTWGDVKATLDRLPTTPPPDRGRFDKEIASLKASRAEAEAELDQLRAKLLQDRTPEQVRMVGTWLERIGAAKPLFDRVLKLEENPAVSAANMEAAETSKKALDGLADLYKNFRTDLPAQSASSIFLEGQIRLLELEQAHVLRVAAIQDRLQAELVRVESLRKRSLVLLGRVGAKYPDATKINESFAKAKTENPELVPDMASALYHVAACSARADLPVRLAAHRESLELRAQGLRRDAANSAVYEKTIANGIQRLAAYHKGGVRPQNLAAFIRALATAGLIPAILTR